MTKKEVVERIIERCGKGNNIVEDAVEQVLYTNGKEKFIIFWDIVIKKIKVRQYKENICAYVYTVKAIELEAKLNEKGQPRILDEYEASLRQT